jgi:hypothetical protein
MNNLSSISSLIFITLMMEAMPHGVTSKTTAFFIVTAMKTSNLSFLESI